MTNEVPQESRLAGRALHLDGDGRVLHLHAEGPKSGHRFRVMPGGGLHLGGGVGVTE